MEEEQKIKGQNFFYWQLPVFLIPFLFTLVKLANFLNPQYREIIKYEVERGHTPGLLKTILLSIINPFSSLPFFQIMPLIWLVLGIIGLVYSIKILKSQTNFRGGLWRFIISGVMILIPSIVFLNMVLVGIFINNSTQEFRDINTINQNIIEQALVEEFSQPKKITKIDMTTDQYFPIMILEDGQKIQLYNFSSENLLKFDDFKSSLIDNEVRIELPERYIFQSGTIPQVLVYLDGELINSLFSSN